jgi:small subunit ribosomal protein S2
MLSFPMTLTHNDFNPRNLCLRRGGVLPATVLYDWELAFFQNPQHDLIEFLVFVLEDGTPRRDYLRYADFYLENLERRRDAGEFDRLPKKEALRLNRQIERLRQRVGGLRTMKGLPNLVFVVDVCREETAIKEANRLGIPVVAVVDSNCDPSSVDYIIPSNDDAIRAIKLIVGKIADAVLEGKAIREKEQAEAEEAAAQAAAQAAPQAEAAAQPELAEDELLGASTLEKIQQMAEAEAPAAEEAPAAAEAEAAEAEGENEAPEA